ncbi:MAG: hypothetical protein EOO14_11090 [Chitinophagaceae bacterium]|nr:MAG: hypothetical protein EOO14_11090 [Chitinophagaceae bacterium]
MKWVLSHATDGLHHWLLQQEENTRSLIFNLQRLSLRLMGLTKRIFFLQVQGLLNKKILLRSEYGVVIGEAPFVSKPSPGQFTINGQKMYHRIEDEKLVLLNSQKAVVGRSDLTTNSLTDKFEFYSLLFGFAWFLTADIAEKDRVLPATA